MGSNIFEILTSLLYDALGMWATFLALELSAAGKLIAGVFYLISGGVLWLVWAGLKPWGWKWIVLVSLGLCALVIPWADEVYITWRFSELCKDAGLYVTRKVVVEGFLEDTSRSAAHVKEGLINDPQAIKDFDKAGFRFKESMLHSGNIFHLERVKDGLRVTILDRPTARYVYKYTDPRQEVPIGFRLEKRERIVFDSQTGETIGRETGFNRYPGWVEGSWMSLLGSTLRQCPDPGKGPPREHLPAAVLSPLKSNP